MQALTGRVTHVWVDLEHTLENFNHVVGYVLQLFGELKGVHGWLLRVRDEFFTLYTHLVPLDDFCLLADILNIR